MTDKQILIELANIKKQLNEVTQKMDAYFNSKHEDNKATIDYIAMMTDTELPDGTIEEDDIGAQ